MKRKAKSFSFRLRKLWDRIITYKPSIWIIGGTIIAICIFFLGGGIYDILVKPGILGQWQGRILTFYPQRINEQFLMESILVSILYALGAVGLILTYQSTKYVYKPRQAYIMLIVGVSMVTVVYILIEISLRNKIG